MPKPETTQNPRLHQPPITVAKNTSLFQDMKRELESKKNEKKEEEVNREENSYRKVLYELSSRKNGQFLVRGAFVGANVEESKKE